MLLITCALPLEAKPLISFFQLKQTQDTPFSIWENDYIKLIITGVGKISSASATTYLYTITEKGKIDGFLNIGLAGHKELEIGSLVIAHKIIDKSSSRCIYPSFLFDISIPSYDLITTDEIEASFSTTSIYDMEAYGFYEAASCFLPIDLIYSIKIISDNAKQAWINKERLMDLFKPHFPMIQGFIHKAIEFSQKFSSNDFAIPSFFSDHWKFSHTEKYLLKELLQKLDSLHPNLHWEQEEFKNYASAREVLQYLEKKLKMQPIKFF